MIAVTTNNSISVSPERSRIARSSHLLSTTLRAIKFTAEVSFDLKCARDFERCGSVA
jgi:hypothetical protein